MFAVPLGGLMSGARFTAGTKSASPRSTSPSVTTVPSGRLCTLSLPMTTTFHGLSGAAR